MRWAGVVAAIIAAAVDVLYLGLVSSSDPQFLRRPFVATFIALMAACAALSARASAAPWRPFLLGVAAAGLLLLGSLAIFSIGLPLVIAGVMASLGLINAVGQAGSSRKTSGKATAAMAAAGAVVAVVIVLAGFSLAELAIRCPAGGIESGSGPSLLGGSYEYSCDNGTLTISR